MDFSYILINLLIVLGSIFGGCAITVFLFFIALCLKEFVLWILYRDEL